MSLVTQKCRLEWEEGIQHLQVFFLKKERDTISFSLYHAFFNLSFLRTPPTTSLSSPFTTPPILVLRSFSVLPRFVFSVSCSLSLTPLWRFFSSAGASRAGGYGDSVLFPPTHERTAARHRRPRLWNHFSLQIVCASCGVFVFLSSDFLLKCSRGSGMLKAKACEGALGSTVRSRDVKFTCGEEKGLYRDLRCAPGGCDVINKALASWREQRCGRVSQ